MFPVASHQLSLLFSLLQIHPHLLARSRPCGQLVFLLLVPLLNLSEYHLPSRLVNRLIIPLPTLLLNRLCNHHCYPMADPRRLPPCSLPLFRHVFRRVNHQHYLHANHHQFLLANLAHSHLGFLVIYPLLSLHRSRRDYQVLSPVFSQPPNPLGSRYLFPQLPLHLNLRLFLALNRQLVHLPNPRRNRL